MKKIPHLEVNCIPSQLNTSAPSGVAAQLASVAENKPSYDNVTIDQMRGNPLYQRIDTIDKIGLAQKQIIESAHKVKSKSGMIRAFNEVSHKMAKPNQSRK